MKPILPLLAIPSLLFCFCAILVGPVYGAPVSISFGGTERTLPRKASLSISTIDIETGDLIGIVKTGPRSRIKVECDTRYCLAALVGSSVGRVKRRRVFKEYFGNSKGFGSSLTASKLRTIRIAVRSARSGAASSLPGEVRIASLAPSLRVGIPANGFTIAGTVAEETISRGVAAAFTTTLAQSPCYRGEGSFVVVETDPRIQAARKREFDLIKKGFAQPDPSFVDNYQAPNASVTGSVSSQGGSAVASVQLRSTSGKVIAEATATVTSGGWLAAVDQAALNLGGKLCAGPRISVSRSQCVLQQCTCCARADEECKGFRVELRLEGASKLPVGAISYVSLGSNSASTQSCGGTQPTKFGGAALACTRATADQPESFSWSASTVLPPPPSCTCPRSTAPQTVSMVATAINMVTFDRDDVVLDSVACSFDG